MASGVCVAFDLGRGFGFVRSPAYREDVFVHLSVIDGGKPLKAGQRVEFAAEPTDRGLRAIRVVPGRPGLSPTMAGIGLLCAALVALEETFRRLGARWFVAWFAAIWAVTWAAYAWDKRRAGLGDRRVPESALLGLALIGGSPAALLAMIILHHKTRKPRFLIRFAAVLLAQAGAVLAYLKYR